MKSNRSSLYDLYFQEPAGRFGLGHLLARPLLDEEIDQLEKSDVGRWECDLMKGDALTWSNEVYEIFGLAPGSPVDRDEALKVYHKPSREVLDRVRTYAINHKCSFILDAEISGNGNASHWIRILAIPVFEDGRVIRLRGLKRVL